MKTMKTTTAMLLAVAAFSVSSQAQTTTNLIINGFDAVAEVTNGVPWNGSANGWGNWFGSAFVSATWDSTQDANNNPSSGSMKVITSLAPHSASNYSQYVLFDGFFTFSADMYNIFSNVSFDIKFDATSVTRTNADGTIDFGAMRFGEFDGYGQDWIYYFAIPATNGLGHPNTNWTHISIPVNQDNTFNFWPNITTFSDIIIGMDAGSGGTVPPNNFNFGGIPLSQAAAEPLTGNTNMNGNQIFWIDNVQLIGPVGGIFHPVSMSAVKATPALRAFIGSANIYARAQLTTVNANESWVGGSYPVTYSFKLLDFPNVNQVQTHLEIIPGPAYTGNSGADYGNTNCLWLQILSDGNGGYTANVSWKTNNVNNNPNNTEFSIASTNSPAGTWTLTFNSATTGTVSGPGFSATAFTIHDPNVVNDFGNPATLVVGNQPNGVTSGEGLPSDYAGITVTGTAGPISDNFTTASTLDPVWTTANADNPNSVVLVTSSQPLWLNWNNPYNGYGLGVSTSLTSGNWMLPQYYNGYYTTPTLINNGKFTWALVPISCLPTVDGNPQIGQALSPNAFFRLSNPPPAN